MRCRAPAPARTSSESNHDAAIEGAECDRESETDHRPDDGELDARHRDIRESERAAQHHPAEETAPTTAYRRLVETLSAATSPTATMARRWSIPVSGMQRTVGQPVRRTADVRAGR